jgi:tetratricopeptide (TPR) repeat protein
MDDSVSQTFLGKTQPELQTPGGGALTDPSRLERGSTIGRYVILEPLGEGGMGCVYAAYDPSLDRRVALKLLKPDFSAAAPDEARQRLFREAQAMARLNHPNVITVHDVGAMHDQVFVAMEMVKGGTLRTWLKAAPRAPREVLHQFALAGEGLWAAHQAGLVHRDFKPENVLVSHDGQVRVTDFGLARSSSEALLLTRPALAASARLPLTPITLEGAVMGTPAYMAPEQLLGRPTDSRTDQFSFAVALYEALFGARPFDGGTLAELAAAIAKGEVKPAPPGSPRWMREPLLRSLKANPLERWPSMRELLHALKKDPRIARRRWLYATAGVVLMAGAGVASKRVVDREQARCETRGSLEGVWDRARRDAALAAFSSSGAPSAEQTFELAAAKLDALAQSWSREAVMLCRQERSLRAADVATRAQCLQRRRDELESIGGVFAEADRLVVDTAVAITTRGPDTRECVSAEEKTVPSEVAVPPELRARLEHARLLSQAGRREAVGLLEGVLHDARTLGNPRFTAEAQWRLAMAYDVANDPRSIETFRSAELGSEAAGEDEQLANVRLDFMSSLGFGHGQTAEAERVAAAARATLDRLGKHDRLEALYMSKLSDLKGLEGKYDEALELGRRALALYTQRVGADAPETLDAEALLINVLINYGRYDEALAMVDHNISATARLFGPDHHMTGVSFTTKGLAMIWAGRYEEARAAIQRAVEIDEKCGGPDAAGNWVNLSNLGEVLQHLGRHAEALELYERAQRLIQLHNPDDAQAMGEVLAGLGRSHLASGHASRALPEFEQALKLREQRPGERANLAENELSLAEALWETHRDRARALGLARSARKMYAEGGDGDAKAVARVDQWLATHH